MSDIQNESKTTSGQNSTSDFLRLQITAHLWCFGGDLGSAGLSVHESLREWGRPTVSALSNLLD